MTDKELKILRMNLVGGMTDFILNSEEFNNKHKEYWCAWALNSRQSCINEDVIKEISDNKENFIDACTLFAEMVSSLED